MLRLFFCQYLIEKNIEEAKICQSTVYSFLSIKAKGLLECQQNKNVFCHNKPTFFSYAVKVVVVS